MTSWVWRGRRYCHWHVGDVRNKLKVVAGGRRVMTVVAGGGGHWLSLNSSHVVAVLKARSSPTLRALPFPLLIFEVPDFHTPVLYTL